MDTILRGGRVIDPASETDQMADVWCHDGVIAGVGPGLAEARLEAQPDTEVIDCTGAIVTPGLIDLHVHIMEGLGNFCVNANDVGVGMGVPTVVDGGTSGVATFDIARRAVIDHPTTLTKVLAFIDPNQLYLATRDFICHKLEIANDERNIDAELLAESIERNADIIVGMKVRTCWTEDPERSPFLEAAMAAAPHLPVMVHLGRFPHTPVISTSRLLQTLRPGDIITHAFRGAGGMMSPAGKVIPQFRDAVDRGVRLDVGHSGSDFRFKEAKRLFDQGFLPDTISTDLNVFNLDGPVYTLAETMTKIWTLGVELRDVIAMVTINVARSIGRLDELGALAPGRRAEVSVLRVENTPITLSDGVESLEAERRVVAVGCLRAGTWYDAAPARDPALKSAPAA